MPNNCKNVIKIKCSDEALMKKIQDTLFRDCVNDDGNTHKEFTMENYMSRPEEEEDNWYDWNIQHWGTKWDCYYTDILHESPTELEVYYMTAWNPNWRFLREYINNELLGKVEYIQYYFYEYGCNFSGYYRYENGEEIQEYFNHDEEVFKHLSPLTPEEQARVDARKEAFEKELREHPENFTII